MRQRRRDRAGTFGQESAVADGGGRPVEWIAEERTMSTVTIAEAQARLPDLLAALAPGQEIQIMDRDRPVARLVAEPARECKPRQPGSAVGKLLILKEDDEHLNDFGEYVP
jgi:antitoxin (DNA-binding transcriptional repressor) of toxin-antitoxin stability system